MKKIITFFSDIHGKNLPELSAWFIDHPGDILVFTGDMQLNQYDNGFYTLEWIHSLPYKYKVMTLGNHDWNYEGISEYVSHLKDIRLLMNSSTTIEGINFFGSPYSPIFGNWYFMETEENLEKMYAKIPENTNILLTHTPPYGIMDVSTYFNESAGSKSLRERVFNLKNLKYHAFGHIHEGRGICVKEGITFVNSSVLNEKYQLASPPKSFVYNKEKK